MGYFLCCGRAVPRRAALHKPRAGASGCHLQTPCPNKRIGDSFLHASARDMDRSSLRPLVGVTACLKENGRGGWHHTVGDKYVRAAIHAVGGLPVLIPAIGPELGADEQATIEALDRLLDTLDGVLLTGSPSNVEPHHYGGEQSRQGTAHDPARDATTLPLIRHSLDRGVPLFAICRGAQEVNVALGGTLHQLVHEVEGRRDHRSLKSSDIDVNYGPAHDIDIVDGGVLHRLLGERRVQVNSLHAQGVDRLAPRARLEAVAEDGQVEAFSVPDAPAFALALQWHPEHRALENPVSMKLFDAFAAACRSRAAARLAPPMRAAAE
jgi:putative glutamine amidotransferase